MKNAAFSNHSCLAAGTGAGGGGVPEKALEHLCREHQP